MNEAEDIEDALFIRFKSKKWFIKNAWQDFDEDWWPSEEAFKDWDVSGEDGDDLSKWVTYEHPGQVISRKLYEKIYIDWAVKEYITKEKYPEYYL